MLASSNTRARHISSLEIRFVLLILIVGIPMIVLIPPGAGYDEEDHLVRVWELSRLSFIPGQLSPQEMQYPIVFRDFAYRQQGSSGVIDDEFWQTYARASFYEYGVVRREIDTKSVYSPPLLLPQAIVMRLFGRNTSIPALMAFYASRFAGLASYLVLVWVAIRLIPFGKWILLVLALSPMSLFQAATISPDAISNGIGFLFIAGSLRTAGQKEIGWRGMAGLAILIFLLFLAKLNLIPLVLLPFLIMSPAKFAQKRMYFFLLAIALILFAVEVAGWNAIAVTRSNPLLANEANPRAQILYILNYPLTFLLIVMKDVITNGWTYLQSWINGYGYYYWTPPQFISLFFLLSLGSALMIESIPKLANKRLRIGLLVVFVGGYLATLFAEYTTFTPVGLDQIFGVQGRYFIPLAPLLFLALPSIPWPSKMVPPSPRWIILFLAIALSLNLLGIFLSFHVPCGTTFYQAGLCYQPLSRDFTDTRPSAPISEGISLAQDIQVMCNGFSEVRALLIPSTPEDMGTTHFILQDPVNNQTPLDVSVANKEITEEDWYPLRFEPNWNSAGKQYILRILGSSTPAGQGLRVLYTSQPEFDLGILRENEQPLQEDIVLQYGCVTGLRNIWLTGKP